MSLIAKFKENGFVHVLVFLSIMGAGFVISILQLFFFILIYSFSKKLYRRINYHLCYSFYALQVFVVEWWAEIELQVYVNKDDFNKYFGKEHSFCVMNHTYEIDWILGYMFCNEIDILGNCRAYIKKALQYIPIIGWIWYFGDMIMLERSFQKDERIIKKYISEIMDYPTPFWLLIFPEGTRHTPLKYEQNQAYAREKSLPTFKHHLTPRTKGFTTSVKCMKGRKQGFYDITLSFKAGEKYEPTFANMVNGRKMKGYVHVSRISFDDVPTEEKEATQFLYDLFAKKDKLQDSFYKTGDYFALSGIERETYTFTITRSYRTLVNFIFWAVLVLSHLFYYLYYCLLSKCYVQFFVSSLFLFLLSILLRMLLNYAKKTKGKSKDFVSLFEKNK